MDWAVCVVCKPDGGIGVRLPDGTVCLAHANDLDLATALRRLGAGSRLDARGVQFTNELLAEVLDAVPRDPDRPGSPLLVEARFNQATFGDGARFDRATFGHGARFDNATFGHRANFAGAKLGDDAGFVGAAFGDEADFSGAAFGDDAEFNAATFGHGAGFGGVTFGQGAEFHRAIFGDEVEFLSATFGDDAEFIGATFGDYVDFEVVTFGVRAVFTGTSFGDYVHFDSATFDGHAKFGGAVFGNGAMFHSVTFGRWADFVGATFGDSAGFDSATFGDWANFSDATFGAGATFSGTIFGEGAQFTGATFGDVAEFGPIVVRGQLGLRLTTFGRSPELTISASRVRCEKAKFPDGAYLQLRWAEVTLDGTQFGRPSILAMAPPSEEFHVDEPVVAALAKADGQDYRTEQPRLVCVAGSDVTNLAINDCDLRACRFIAAHNLDTLRLESRVVLPTTPTGWRRGRAWPPVWRWARRQTIAEEHHWRQQRPERAGWAGPVGPGSKRSPYTAEWHDHGWRDDPAVRERPAEIAAVYRALRKGREDTGDEPGAADFYYGEMEMRRHDSARPVGERLVLWLYWLLAGYALRASRAVAWLLGVLVVATVLLASVGLHPPTPPAGSQTTGAGTPPPGTTSLPSPTVSPGGPTGVQVTDRSFAARLGTAALAAAEGAVFRASEQGLTFRGRVIQAVLRFVGPVLLALAVLSVRGRVKR